MAELLPLFPLNTVLFPHAALPLHIFEERYKEMIGEVITGKSEFGVLCDDADTVPKVGCTAKVVKEIHRYDDGRMNILTVGLRRFQIIRLQQDKTYLQGEVHFFMDEPIDERQELKARCLQLFQDLYESTPGHIPFADLETVSTEEVSFFIAYYSDFPLEKKQRLLELTNAEERLVVEEEALHERLDGQREQRGRRQILESNGHFPRT